jgi:hypothetical protein
LIAKSNAPFFKQIIHSVEVVFPLELTVSFASQQAFIAKYVLDAQTLIFALLKGNAYYFQG